MKLNQYNEALKALEHVITVQAKKVPYKTSLDAPSTYKAMKEFYLANGYFLIYSGASESTIFSSPEVNVMFRAWHDAGHFLHGLSFKFDDEKRLGVIQAREAYWTALTLGYDLSIARRVKSIVRAEIVGQIEYFEHHKDYVKDQKAYTLKYLGVES